MELGIIGKYTSINEAEELEKNPYIEYLNVNERVTLKKFKKNEAVVTDKIKDYETITELTNQNKDLITVDLEIGKRNVKGTSHFALLYLDQVIDYKSLSGNCLKTLFYIFYERLELGQDKILLNPKDLVEHLGISKSSAYSIFVELLNANIIRKRNDYTWWINPNYFYRGNRLNINSK